ncbi:MAG: Gmad2 immunoglobulin-like domain-containing protein [bacterium]|nr:Gmad2 immunoglobulin-like domain-containing protein [bacterium]
MRNFLYIPLILIVAGGGAFALTKVLSVGNGVTADVGFLECAATTGSVIMNTRPDACVRSDGRVFVENVSNLEAKKDLVRNVSIAPNEKVRSPLLVTGEARGYWSFEADFPVRLLDGKGKVLDTAIATMQGDWMSQDFVPFTATLRFAHPQTQVGLLILQKDNPSGLPEHDDEVLLQVTF